MARKNNKNNEISANERIMKLEPLAKIISDYREKAINFRKNSGIEDIWLEDEEYYEGVDDLNRSIDSYMKTRSTSGNLIAKDMEEDRCTAFFNITRQFVDSASARCADILLPANDWNFLIKATPIPSTEETSTILDQSGQPFQPEQNPQNKEAEEKVELAEKRIKDWLIDGNYKREFRKILENAAKVGTGILKGPIPFNHRTFKHTEEGLMVKNEIIPVSMSVSHWDLFPDPCCGDDIHNGSYLFERMYMSSRQLNDLKEDSTYIDEAINKVLKEGPYRLESDTTSRSQNEEERPFEVWFFYGEIKLNDLMLLDPDYSDTDEFKDTDTVPMVITMVNDTIIKGAMAPLPEGNFPFDVMVWQRQEGSPFGIGVARQGRSSQRMILSSMRALMDNMGLSAVPMIALAQYAIDPADGDYTLRPGKVWLIKEASGIKNANEAIQSIVIPSLQEELQAIVQLGMLLMESQTGVSLLLQGQQGAAPDTVGGMQLLHQNASALLRRVARIADEYVTIPHINRYYKWLLLYGEDAEKGDLTIEALGSSALVEREIQAMQLPQILQLSLEPRFKKSPAKVFDEILKAWKFEPTRFDMDEEEIKELEAMMSNEQQTPQIAVAQIRSQTTLQQEQMRQQALMAKMKLDTDRDAVFQQGVNERNVIAERKAMAELELRNQELQLKRDIAMLEYASKNEIKLADVKTELTALSMKLNATRELAQMHATADHLPKPPTEPPQKASKGHSFTE